MICKEFISVFPNFKEKSPLKIVQTLDMFVTRKWMQPTIYNHIFEVRNQCF